jgi:hypothetical protein
MKEVTHYKKHRTNPHFALCAAIVCNIVGDMTMRPGKARSTGDLAHLKTDSRLMTRRLELIRCRAINDLQKFKKWPLFIRAADAGMTLPTDEQIQKIIDTKPSIVGDNFYRLTNKEG